MGKESAYDTGDVSSTPRLGRSQDLPTGEEEMATHSSIFA